MYQNIKLVKSFFWCILFWECLKRYEYASISPPLNAKKIATSTDSTEAIFEIFSMFLTLVFKAIPAHNKSYS